MSHNKDVMTMVETFNSVIHGGAWYGKGFDDILQNMDESLVFSRPTKNQAGIAELLWHCTYWCMVVIKYMNDDKDYRRNTHEKLNFKDPIELFEIGWVKLKNQFYSNHESLIKELQNKNDDWLDTYFDKDYSFRQLLNGVIQHNIYHLGQIVLIHKLMEKE